MPVTQISDPVVTVKDLIKDNWNAANVQSVTPTWSTGWYDKQKILPLVTVTAPDDVVEWRGFDPLGNGGVQGRRGVVEVNCWVDRDVVVSGSAVGTAGAKKLAYQMKQEADRIVTANQNGVADFQHLDIGFTTLLVELDESPAVYRRLLEVVYRWIKQPA